ncbi:cytochrome P450 [Lophium mytilinum]|uniref:Cytochrome P450 n=1 Tax=Lophium mytilinum TaxID=390894 RepID=A0A6A6R6L9_9PEZI|nr:cytochrome P450 [Lophium mytilinum]
MGFLHSYHLPPAIIHLITTSPTLTILTTLLAITLLTRALTELQRRHALTQTDLPLKTPIRIPYWIPFVGSAISFARDVEGTLAKDRDSSGDGLISYRLGPSTYYVINMPSLVRQVFAQKAAVLSKEKILYWFMRVAFGDGNAARTEHAAFHESHKALNLMLKDDFVTEATGKTARAVELKSGSLVTSKGSEQAWEKAGGVTYNEDGSADANFYGLVVNYVGQVVIDMLYGEALIKNNPELQKDLWDFDEGVHHLVSSLGAFTAAGRRAKEARRALVMAMDGWHAAVAAVQRGQDPGPEYQDLDDVSEVMRLRVKTWVDSKASTKLQTTNDVSVLWGVNVNSNKNIFWMLMQIYAQRELLSDIRKELAAYVKTSSTGECGANGLPKLDIDVDGLCKYCPLIKASFYETMRMNMSGLGIRQVNKDLVVTESAEDAAMFGKKKPQSYRIPAGSSLVLANGTMQQDPRIFEEPEKFRPGRFIEGDGKDEPVRVVMKNLHTFGGGLYKCKGRYFAEKEVLIFAASILMMWDLRPADGSDVLEIPAMGLAGASRSPVADVRVRLTRRYS